MLESTTHLAFLGPIGWPEMVILAVLGVLIFGKRLPEVGKSIGKGIVEFKKGLAGIDEEVEEAVNKQNEQRKLENSSSATTHVDTAASETASPAGPSAQH
ncbi:MAG: twin-arginine translocase TatA/TatE family subunit [Planctomycetota bacterium]